MQDFIKTHLGRKFFDVTLPGLVTAIRQLDLAVRGVNPTLANKAPLYFMTRQKVRKRDIESTADMEEAGSEMLTPDTKHEWFLEGWCRDETDSVFLMIMWKTYT